MLTVDTPKSEACSDWSLITFHATQKSLDEYLAAAPDIPSLRAAVLAIPGVPSDVRLSFAGARLDKEDWEVERKRKNKNIARIGCQDYRAFLGGRPIPGPDTSTAPDDGSGRRDIEDP